MTFSTEPAMTVKAVLHTIPGYAQISNSKHCAWSYINFLLLVILHCFLL